MQKKEKPKTWMRRRHRVITALLKPFVSVYVRIAYGIRPEPFRQQGDRAYLVLLNHQTVFDQFFVGISFNGPVYYVATEDIFSMGWVSSLIRWLVAPIPIRKQTTDISAVMTCMRVAREGGTIAMAPEGNRTYSGKTEYMNPAIAALARKMKLPIALYRIEGGYGVQPRWADKLRRGKMRGYIAQVIEPETYAAMTNDELLAAIRQGLYVNEGCPGGTFKSRRKAEYLERAVYICPFCGLSKFESRGDHISCTTCGRTIAYGEDKVLTGQGFEFPFRYVNDWYRHQEDYVNQLDTRLHTDVPLFRDEADLSEVIVYQNKNLLRPRAKLALYGNRITVDEDGENPIIFPFEELEAVTVLGKNKLNIYHGKQVYQLKGDKRFNALKYVHIFYRHRNILRGEETSRFLGL